jgi:hypothetical protein
MPFSAHILARLGWSWKQSNDLAVIRNEAQVEYRRSFSESLDAARADAIWEAAGETLAASASKTYELDALEKSLFGDTLYVSFLTLRAVYLHNRSAAATLGVGGAPSDPWQGPFGDPSDTLLLPPGAVLLLTAPATGWPVTTTARDLRITAEAAEAEFDLVLVGTITEGAASSSA